MKRKEFLSRLKYLGYKGYKLKAHDGIYILDEDDKVFAYIGETERYEYEISSVTDELLVDLIFQYSKTPIADREEEKLYLLSLPNCSYSSKYLEINIDNQTEYRIKSKPKTSEIKVTKNNTTREVKRFQMVFTKSEIKELDNQRFIQSLHTEYFKEDI